MRIGLIPGQVGDNPQLVALLDGISVGRDGPGRPRCRPEVVISDKACSHPATRQVMRQGGIRMVCPERADQIAHRAAKGSRGGRAKPASPSPPSPSGSDDLQDSSWLSRVPAGLPP